MSLDTGGPTTSQRVPYSFRCATGPRRRGSGGRARYYIFVAFVSYLTYVIKRRRQCLERVPIWRGRCNLSAFQRSSKVYRKKKKSLHTSVDPFVKDAFLRRDCSARITARRRYILRCRYRGHVRFDETRRTKRINTRQFFDKNRRTFAVRKTAVYTTPAE